MPLHRLEHKRVINAVEERPDIKIYHPVAAPAPFPAPAHRVQRRTSRTVAIGAGVEDRFHLPLQIHRRHRLGDPVVHSRNAEDPRSSPCLRYCHGLDRRREVTPRREPVPQLEQVVFQILLVLLDRAPVGTRRALVGPDPQIRLPAHMLGNLKRFRLRLRFAHLAPPEHIGRPPNEPGQPAPFAPAPLQDLHRYYKAVRPPAPHRYSPPRGFRRLRFSLTLAAPTRSLNRDRATSAPDTHLASKQAPARLFPGQQLDPGFGLSSLRFRRFISGSLTFAFSAHT